MAKTGDFLIDQLGRAPLYVLLIAALWYMHGENKETQSHLVRILETTSTTTTTALIKTTNAIEEQTKSNQKMQQELELHRALELRRDEYKRRLVERTEP